MTTTSHACPPAGLVAQEGATNTLPKSRNLLTSSHAFHRSHWVKGSTVPVLQTWNPRRGARLNGERVVREAGAAGTAVLRHTVTDIPSDAESLVGTVYARSKVPTSFELALGRIVAREAGTAWTRCVTPPVDAQRTGLLIRTTEPGAALGVRLWGAQVEAAVLAGPVARQRPPALPWPQLHAMEPEHLLLDDDAGRGDALALPTQLLAVRLLEWYGIACSEHAIRETGGRI
jgi:hypothetical protein